MKHTPSNANAFLPTRTLSVLTLTLITALAASLTGCARYGDPAAPADAGQKGLGTVPGPGLAVAPATSEQCVAGGLIYTVFVDQNRNGTFEADETVTSTQVVCNGVNGTNGTNGANGSNGANGTNGSNGHSIVFQTVSAPSDLCANGGTTIVMALDVFDTGEYHASLPQQRAMTLCNGLNGSDGANGTNGSNGTNGADAPVPMYAAVDSIQPCGNSGAYQEVLLRLQSGQVLASFSNDTGGTMTRLTFLPDGTYMTTDATSCQFTLATSQNGTLRSISWFGQIQKLWNML